MPVLLSDTENAYNINKMLPLCINNHTDTIGKVYGEHKWEDKKLVLHY